jgi:bifunctional non-homologous end joining protein LigD
MPLTRVASKIPAEKPPRGPRPRSTTASGRIPLNSNSAQIEVDGRAIQLTNLQKLFWRDEGIRKGDLLRFYASVAEFLLPHLVNRAMVMKRYPNGADGPFFFQKRAPVPRPQWIDTCPIKHTNSGIIDFPVVRDLASLLWIVNLGCIDLNPWYARCDEVYRPDFLHFDLDPVPGASFDKVRQTALIVRDALESIKIPSFAKTTGSRGIHVYVPIARGPEQKEVWGFAKSFSQTLERLHPKLITAEYRISKRPKGHVLVDYNQNAWGRTLASVYSVRPKPLAPVSTPVTWEEINQGIEIEDFRIDNVPQRLSRVGDLWSPLLQARGRVKLEHYFTEHAGRATGA